MGLGKVLAIARRDVIHVGHLEIVEEVPTGTLDPDWIPVVARRGLIAIGHDKRIRTRPGERELIVEHGLRVIRIDSRRDLSTWAMLNVIVRQWPKMEDAIEERGAGPWFMRLRSTGMTFLPL